ncbi:MAG: phosphopantothenoylcysteine decarboxylase [Candidatus Altiarchaeota archaeon]|nr:phosphopantothenoylcysteine decarboxylase [Candidatus Altiarchaeota archaeon]
MTRFLISAGPTQEPIDDVRFITNASSGAMGFALAKAAAERGHKVTMVVGPVAVMPSLRGVRVVRVRTAGEMARAVECELSTGFDVFISAAAVGDYTPVKAVKGKLSSKGGLVLRLKPTKKITRLAKRKFPRVFVVAFKAEYGVPAGRLVARAFEKLASEGLDLIVANDVMQNRMGAKSTDAYVIGGSGEVVHMPHARKAVVARRLVRVIESCLCRAAF